MVNDAKQVSQTGNLRKGFSFAKSKDNPKADQVCIVSADMIGSTKFWSAYLTKSATEITQGWKFISRFQTTIIQSMLDSGGWFIKGVGDELIFRFDRVTSALEATRNTQERLGVLVTDLKTDKDQKSIFKHWKLAELPPFRFVIHWATDKVVFGLYNVCSIQKKERGLKSAKPVGKSGAIVRFPQSPDLFGHHMNYTARCLHAISDNAVYLTKHALDKLTEEGTVRISVGREMVPIQKLLGWPIQVGGTKGLRESVIFQKVWKTAGWFSEAGNKDATVDAYKTKALVYLANLERSRAKAIFKKACDIMQSDYTGGSDAIQKLLPHVFLFFYTTGCPWKGIISQKDDTEAPVMVKNDKSYAVFRFESLDAEYLEELLLDERGVLKIFNARGKRVDGSVQDINSETRFIRTKEQKRTNAPRLGKWCNRGETFHPPIFYAEIQPVKVIDIDRYADRILRAQSSDGLEIIELGRLWGKPSIYVLVKSEHRDNAESCCISLLRQMRNPCESEKGATQDGAELTVWQCGEGKSMDLIKQSEELVASDERS